MPESLSGYCELGMKRDAMKVASQILAKPRIAPVEFSEVIRALGMMASQAELQDCKVLVQAAYERQPLKTKKAMGGEMLRYYYSLKDWVNALRFLSAHELKNAENAVFAMDLLLETKRMKEAKRFARQCEKWLQVRLSRFEAGVVMEALASYSAQVGEWDKALHFWGHAPLEEPFRHNALSGIVAIHLARALEAVQTGLHALDDLKKSPDMENAISLPGNDEAMTRDAEKELLWFKRRIEKLLPEATRKELGIDKIDI